MVSWVNGFLLTPRMSHGKAIELSGYNVAMPDFDSLFVRKDENGRPIPRADGWDLDRYGPDEIIRPWWKLPAGQRDRLRQAGILESKAYGYASFFCVRCRTFEFSRHSDGEYFRSVKMLIGIPKIGLGLHSETSAMGKALLALGAKIPGLISRVAYIPHRCLDGTPSGLWWAGMMGQKGGSGRGNIGIRGGNKWGRALPAMPYECYKCPTHGSYEVATKGKLSCGYQIARKGI